MLAPGHGSFRIALLASLPLFAAPLSSAFACDMSNSMTDATCANMGFPNVFNNPPMPPPVASPAISSYSGPVYAYGILGLLEGPHPTMIYPRQPIVCRQGIDCPGDAPEVGQQPERAAYHHPSHSGRRHRRRLTQAAPR